jgi:prolipoprotein diacylglyceryl transferase
MLNTLKPTINLFFFDLRIYGLVYALTLLFVYIYTKKYFLKNNLSEKQFEKTIIYTTISIIFFARLYHVFVSEPSYYLANPSQIIAIWNGGLGFFGGFFGFLFAFFLFSKKYHFSYAKTMDLFFIIFILSLSIGRVANFFNHEIYGRETDSILGVQFCEKFKVEQDLTYDYSKCLKYTNKRHPTQLYESFAYLITFLFSIFYLKKKKLYPGIIAATIGLMYSVSRFIVEFYKEDPGILFFNTVNQAFCVLTGALSIYVIYLIIKINSKTKKENNTHHKVKKIK